MVFINRSATVITVADLLTAIVREPVVCGCEGDDVALIADLDVRGVWQALFDVQVTNTDAPSYINKSVSSLLATAEEEKRKYGVAVKACHASFTSFVVSVWHLWW